MQPHTVFLKIRQTHPVHTNVLLPVPRHPFSRESFWTRLLCARLQTVLEVSVHWSFPSLHLDPTMYYCFLVTFPSLGFKDGILPGLSFCFPKLFSADFFVAFSSLASPLTFRVLQHIIPRSFYLHTLSEPPWSHSLSWFSVSSIHWHFPISVSSPTFPDSRLAFPPTLQYLHLALG